MQSKKNIKRLLSVILTLCVMLLFSSCNQSDTTVISLDNEKGITADIFSYYLKKSMIENKGLTKQNYLDTATNECIKFAAINKSFKDYNMKLTPAQKAKISETTNVLWQQYGDYYSLLGLTKQSFYNIQTTEQYKESIRFYLYDTGGQLAVDENQIKAVFNEHYVGFRFVYDYLYDTDSLGNTVKKSQDDIDKIYNDYVNAANSINNKGSNLEEAYASFATDEAYNSLSLDTVVINENNTFPDGFYTSVKKTKTDESIVVISDDYIYLVVREDILSADLSGYEEHRNESLIILTDTLLNNQLASWANEYNAVRKLSKAEKCYRTVINTDEKIGEKLE